MNTEEILNDLKPRRQKVKEGPGFGTVIPQVEITGEDIDKAKAALPGVDNTFLTQYGFLTTVYRNAAKRTGTDIRKIDANGLFIKFQ